MANQLALEVGQRVSSKTTQQLCSTPLLCLPCRFALREANLCIRSQGSLLLHTSSCGASIRLCTDCSTVWSALNLAIISQCTWDLALKSLGENKQRWISRALRAKQSRRFLQLPRANGDNGVSVRPTGISYWILAWRHSSLWGPCVLTWQLFLLPGGRRTCSFSEYMR